MVQTNTLLLATIPPSQARAPLHSMKKQEPFFFLRPTSKPLLLRTPGEEWSLELSRSSWWNRIRQPSTVNRYRRTTIVRLSGLEGLTVVGGAWRLSVDR